MTKSIMFANQKGGVGKSTLLINFAMWLLRQNKKILFIDTDPQASILSFLQARESNNLTVSNIDFVGTNLKYLPNEIKKNQNKFDYILIDSPGQANADLVSILPLLNFVVIPVKPSSLDIEATKDFIEKIFELEKQDKQINYGVLINGIVPNAKNDAENFKQYLKGSNIKYFNSVVANRKLYSDSLFEGKGIVETNSDNITVYNAINEFEAFVDELLKNIK